MNLHSFNRYFLFAYFIFIQAQAQKIQGAVYDYETKKPIESASISTTKVGTLSNANGQFELHSYDNHQWIEVSVMGYKKQTIKIENPNDFISVFMQPSSILLEEVIVSNFAQNVVKKAILKLKTEQNDYFGKVYYKEKTTLSDTNVVAFKEIFLEKQFNNQSNYKIAIQNTRFCEKPQSYVRFDNAFLVNSFPIIQATDKKTLIFPLRDDCESIFNFSLIRKYDGNIAEIAFNPTENFKKNGLSGSIFINYSTFEIIKITSQDVLLNIPAYNDGFFKSENTTFQIDMNFVNNRLQSIFLNNSSLMTKGVEKTQKQVSECVFLVYEFTPQNKKINYKPLHKFDDDFKAMQKVKYDKNFWLNNPIIKKTPLESKVIALFEQNNSFSNTK
jgi:hypothetical protein